MSRVKDLLENILQHKYFNMKVNLIYLILDNFLPYTNEI